MRCATAAGSCSRTWTRPPPRSSSLQSLRSHDQLFRRLVLGCIDSCDSEQRLILQGFSKSTIFAFFCATPNSKIEVFCMHFLQKFADIFRFFITFCEFFSKIANIFDVNLLNSFDSSGAKECISCRARKTLPQQGWTVVWIFVFIAFFSVFVCLFVRLFVCSFFVRHQADEVERKKLSFFC